MKNDANETLRSIPIGNHHQGNGEPFWARSFQLGGVAVSLKLFRRRFELVISDCPPTETREAVALGVARLDQRKCG